nr:apolipoprotein N-acyltransferase [Succinivibrionaceae bacterium]
AAAAALAARRVYTCLPVAGAILAAGILLHGIAFTTLQGPRLQVGLVQGNIEQRLKWDPGFAGEVVATYWELSRPHLGKLDALVWPEAALPLFLEDAPELISDLNTAAAASSTPILTGLQRHDGDGHAYNIILGLGASADPELAQVYDKRILVPLGEYVPYASFFRQFGNMFNIPMSSFSEGAAGQRPLRLGAVPLIPAICYESVFPTLLAEMDSESAGGILMVSNDAWFGDTRGPLEHLVIARMRSMELQKPQLRATNNGVTALIGPFGGIERRLPQNERGVLEVELQPRQGATPYSRLGNLPLYALALASLLLSLAMARREGRNDALRRLVRP